MVVEESEEDRLARIEQADRGLGEAELLLGVDVEPAREGVLMRGDRRQDRAAVRAAHDAATLELGQVAARRHRRHAEALLELGHGHRAGRAQPVRDLAPARLGQHTGPFV